VLNDFLLDNLKCGTSAMNYYNKIQRLTSSIFPLMVPVSQFLFSLLNHPWYVFAHKDNELKAGDLALFYAVCPQPGINLDL
ncbi:hypothetical protein BD769DRAFT_1301621, partial [Suillus cothurnatus]